VVIEAYAAGPAAVELREETLRPLEVVLAEGRAQAPQVSSLHLEAIVGGIYGLAYRQIRRSGAESLPNLAPVCTYFTLAPLIGPEEACAAANGDGRGRGTRTGDLPYRRMLSQLLRIFNEGNASAEQIARRLDEPLEKVQSLVDELLGSALIEPAGDELRDGVVEVLYRGSPALIEDRAWARLSQAERQEISAGIGHLITGEIDQAIEVGSFDARIDRYLTRVPVRVDEQGWRELMAIHDRALRETLAARDRSAERLRRSGQKGIEGRSVQVLFEAPKR
jgi:hypothetical protein